MDDVIWFVGDLQRLEVRPGDVLVLKTPQHLSKDNADRLRNHIAEVVGEGNKILVLSAEFDLGLLTFREAPIE